MAQSALAQSLLRLYCFTAFCRRAKVAVVSNSTFVSNVAAQNGAAVFQETTPGSLTQCTVANNKAQVRPD